MFGRLCSRNSGGLDAGKDFLDADAIKLHADQRQAADGGRRHGETLHVACRGMHHDASTAFRAGEVCASSARAIRSIRAELGRGLSLCGDRAHEGTYRDQGQGCVDVAVYRLPA
jgi:hypothetical protein